MGDRQALPVFAFTQCRGGQVQVFGGLYVREHMPHSEHFGHVLELGESCLESEVSASGGRHFHLGHGLTEGSRPGVEVQYSRIFEHVWAQVALHHVCLGDAVGDRCGCGHGADAGAVAAAQVFELHVHIGGLAGPGDGCPFDAGIGGEVLVVVHLIDDHVVDASGFEADPGIPGQVDHRLLFLFQSHQLLLQLLDRESVLRLRVLDDGAQRLDLASDVILLEVGRDRQPLERCPGHDHRIPIVRGSAGDEQATLVAGDVGAGSGEDPCLWVDL